MIQQQIQHHYTWAERTIWWLCHSFGALNILICIGGGVFFWGVIICRKVIKDKFGDIIAWADEKINGKK